MDQHDKEFEKFLKQFRLREPRALPANAWTRRRSMARWVIAAAAALILAVAVSSLFVRRSSGGAAPYATVAEAGSPSLYKEGEKIDAGRLIRSNSAVGLLLDLNDGSRVEVRSQSELQLESASYISSGTRRIGSQSQSRLQLLDMDQRWFVHQV